MTASVTEQTLSAIQSAFMAAGIVSTGTICRDNTRPFGEDELPAVNIVRGETITEPHSATLDRNTIRFSVEHVAAGADWSTTADAQLVAAEQLMFKSAELAVLVRGLKNTGTESQADDAEFVAGRITAKYEAQFITRRGNPAEAVI